MAPLRYVALGDSYTIGTSVIARERWPNQLVARLAALRPADPPLGLAANLAVNGFTSGDVIEQQLPVVGRLRPGFVSILVGVNDVVQSVPLVAYRANAAAILDALVASIGAGRVVAVTTPDYTVTPAGADYGDPAAQAAGIDAVNAVLGELAGERGVAVVDIVDLSRLAATDRSLVADDGLHPSGRQYAAWVERILPVVERLLDGRVPPPPGP